METNQLLDDKQVTYTELLNIFERHLQRNKANCISSKLSSAANHILQSKGKRIRPLLLMMSGKLFGVKTNNLLPAALCIELYHNSTLIHDDIMDQSQLRRGQVTTHLKFDTNTAINAGNLLTSLAFQALQNYSDYKFKSLLETFNKASIEVIEGQGLDLIYETQKEVSEEEYLKMIKLKTSVLLAASAKMGAIVADTSIENQNLIYNFALNLGISFQLKDDYLDAFGNMGEFGKKRGGDIVQNKSTLLKIQAYKLGNKSSIDKLNLLENCEDNKLKVDETIAIYERSGAKEYIEHAMQEYYTKALSSLEKIDANYKEKVQLREFAEQVYNRSH